MNKRYIAMSFVMEWIDLDTETKTLTELQLI